jgi:hypothetical protein
LWFVSPWYQNGSSTASKYITDVKDDLKISEKNGSGLMKHYKGIFVGEDINS